MFTIGLEANWGAITLWLLIAGGLTDFCIWGLTDL